LEPQINRDFPDAPVPEIFNTISGFPEVVGTEVMVLSIIALHFINCGIASGLNLRSTEIFLIFMMSGKCDTSGSGKKMPEKYNQLIISTHYFRLFPVRSIFCWLQRCLEWLHPLRGARVVKFARATKL
jgi:hypothetical protein